MERECNAQSSEPLGFMNFTKVIFRPIKRLKLIGSWFPLFSVVKWRIQH